MKFNDNFKRLAPSYLFRETDERVKNAAARNPGMKFARLGTGDVTLPIPEFVTEAGVKAAYELSRVGSFRGYPPARGYPFLISAVEGYYRARGVTVDGDDIFISDGAKTDAAAVFDLFGAGSRVAYFDPSYPVYADVTAIKGMQGVAVSANPRNGFLPPPDGIKADVILLCSPSNPTGVAFDKLALGTWVNHARETGAVIVYDAAYERYVSGDKPRSIYEIDGADEVAIEICSLSKTFGFTGVRCGYTVVPKKLKVLHDAWSRHRSTCFNGVSYVTQRMAQSALLRADEASANACVYAARAKKLYRSLTAAGLKAWGGDAPYVWLKVGSDSWGAFDTLLERGVITTAGCGFGSGGEGYLRLSSFCPPDEIDRAIDVITDVFCK